MKLIYLDFDGVLNDHVAWPNKYNPIKPSCVAQLNRILQATGANIVLSSAWRYLNFSNDISLKGFEYLLLIHGISYDSINDRIIGVTKSDHKHLGVSPEELNYEWLRIHGATLRREQIYADAEARGVARFVVLDDLFLNMIKQVQTRADLGLTAPYAEDAIALLNGPVMHQPRLRSIAEVAEEMRELLRSGARI